MADIVELLLRPAGLELMNLVMDEEVRALAGERHSNTKGGATPPG